MDAADSYVVRIYRRAPDTRALTGIVEHPGAGTQTAFRDVHELRSALAPPPFPACSNKPEKTPASL